MKKSVRKSENTSKWKYNSLKSVGCSKAVPRGKFITVEPFFKKQEESQTI